MPGDNYDMVRIRAFRAIQWYDNVLCQNSPAVYTGPGSSWGRSFMREG